MTDRPSLPRATTGRPERWVPYLRVFVTVLAAAILAYGGRFHVIDEVSIYATAANLAARGALDSDQIAWSQWARPPREVQGDFGPDGHVYSQKGWPTVLFPALLVRLALPVARWGLVFAAHFASMPVTALTATVLAGYLRRLGFRPTTAVGVALAYGLGTLAFPYSRLLFGEPVVALGLVVSLYALERGAHGDRRWDGVAALAFAWTVWARSVNVILLPLWALYAGLRSPDAPLDRGRAWRFALVAGGLGVTGVLAYNAWRYGVPWRTGYQISWREAFTTPPWLGAYGLLLSPFRGLVWFTPLVLAAWPGYRRLRRRWPRRARLLLAAFGVYLLFYSAWWSWSGEFAWGPRFLLPVLPGLMAFVAAAWEDPRWRRPTQALALLSVGVQALAVVADFTLAETVLEMTFGEPKEAWPVLLDPRWSPLVLQVRHLRQGFWDVAWVRLGRAAWPVPAGVGLALLLTWGPAFRSGRWWRRLGPALAVGVLAATAVIGLDRVSAQARQQPFEQAVIQALTTVARGGTPGDVLVTLAPYDYASVLNWNHTRVYVLGLAPHPAPLRPEEARLLQEAARRAQARIWLLTARIPPAHPEALPERWLAERAFFLSHRWIGDLRLLAFAPPAAGPPPRTWSGGPPDAGGLSLVAVDLAESVGTPGGVLRVTTRWRTAHPLPQAYTLFVHLLTADGRYLAGTDAPPVNGFRPTTAWAPGETVVDRKAVAVPATAPPGPYWLEIGAYDPATGERVAFAWQGRTVTAARVGPVPVGRTVP